MQVVIVKMNAVISIHALLAESDNTKFWMRYQEQHFYPRSPCGERRASQGADIGNKVFLSTLSLRRATS